MTHINVQAFVKTPFDLVTILWQVDGASGRTTCEAWRGQYEIECLERAGYQIIDIVNGD